LLEKRKEKRIKRIFASVAKADPFSFEYLLNKSTREKKLKGEKKGLFGYFLLTADANCGYVLLTGKRFVHPQDRR
jgi:hypothetical protein